MNNVEFANALKAKRPNGPTDWRTRHNAAVSFPKTKSERDILALLRAIQSYVPTSRDCYFTREHILEPLCDAAQDALNLDLGRLDGGTLSAAIYQMQEMGCHRAGDGEADELKAKQ